jgi:hypothetical protein
MGALKEVWHNPHLDTYSKYLFFPLNPNEPSFVGM